MNLWDIAVEQSRKLEKGNQEAKDSVVLILGNKKSGKSTICYKFLDRTETPKNTLALEYLFGRRNKGIEVGKEICHIWELGGGAIFTKLLEIPITPKNLWNLSVVLVLDLSKPEELWYTMEVLLNSVSKQIDKALENFKDPSLKTYLHQQSKNRIPSDHEDATIVQPFPVPLLIIGSKYDLFQNLDFETKKIVCKCLRYVAHWYAAGLQFMSFKSETLVSKVRASISALSFGTTCSKSVVMDYNKPLYVCPGADSFQSIGSLSSLDVDNKSQPKCLEAVKKMFASRFQIKENKTIARDDPAADPHFQESEIDIMRAQKEKELCEYKKHKEGKRPPWE